MTFACARPLGLLGLLSLSACFDPGTVVDTESGSEGSSTGAMAETDPAVTTTTPTTDAPPPPTTGPTDTDDPPPTTDPDTTAGPAPECDSQGLDPACDPATPYCADETCVDCTGLPPAACGSIDPATPVCDGETGQCTGCTEHDQCPTGACRFTTGECFAESNRLWVDNTFGGCAGGTGTEDNPFCTVIDAMQVLDSQVGMEPWAIFVAGSPNPYEGTIDPNNNRPVAIIGPQAGLAATLFNQSAFTIDLWAQSPETYLHRLTIDRGFGGPTIRCATGQAFVTDTALLGGDTTAHVTGCSLRLRRTVVNTNGMGIFVDGGELLADQTDIENSSGGLVIDGGSAELRRSTVRDHYVEGGITVLGGGSLRLENSMVYYNQYQNDGVLVTGAGSTAEVVHSTIIGALTCEGATGAVSVRNSIVLGQQFEAGMACPAASVDTSVVNAGLGQGMGNVQADATDLASIFVDPAQMVGADWHVLPGSLPMGVAVHQPGDPLVDFDGDPRPTMAGAEDYAGADVP